MTTDSDGCHVDNFLTEKILYYFSLSKVNPQKTKFNIECFLTNLATTLFVEQPSTVQWFSVLANHTSNDQEAATINMKHIKKNLNFYSCSRLFHVVGRMTISEFSTQVGNNSLAGRSTFIFLRPVVV